MKCPFIEQKWTINLLSAKYSVHFLNNWFSHMTKIFFSLHHTLEMTPSKTSTALVSYGCTYSGLISSLQEIYRKLLGNRSVLCQAANQYLNLIGSIWSYLLGYKDWHLFGKGDSVNSVPTETICSAFIVPQVLLFLLSEWEELMTLQLYSDLLQCGRL